MLKHWTTHDEYQNFIAEALKKLNESQLKKLNSHSDSIFKLTSLNLDPVGQHLYPYYSGTGRPALNQPEIIRSFVLMSDLKETSLTNWVISLSHDDLLAMLIGCTPDSLPPLGSYYDFIDRLWLQNPAFEMSGRADLFPPDKNSKPKAKPGKNKKLPNKHSGITEKCADYALAGRDFPFHYELLLQEIFKIAAITPSIECGIIPNDGITLNGDGTCVHAHSSPYGHRVCNCKDEGINNCSCYRHFSDPDADFGWDSDIEKFFFGHTLYSYTYYNSKYKTDLPMHIRFLNARRHDSVSGIVSLSEFKNLNPGLFIKNICLDSAHDNYPTYRLLKEWNISPFIDLNSKRGKPASIPDNITIDEDGTPLCQAGFRMVFKGNCPGRSRVKWRCPVACGERESCDLQGECSPSPYGRCFYTKPDWDIRLYTPVARGTPEYKETYNQRSSSERMNNRILNDYRLHDMKIHGKKRYSFFTMIAGINIHLDARLKKQRMDAA